MLISLLKNGQIVVNENVLQLASHHPTTVLTSNPYGLTPSPSPRGEGSSMLLQRILLGAYPQHSASPSFHAKREGGVIRLVLLQCTLCSQGIPLPSPLGEGLGVRPVVGWRVPYGGEAGCRVACAVWGEAGCRVACAVWGEAGCRVACCVLCCSFCSFSFFCLYLSLPNMRSR